jgi:uncharacterized protein (TIGR00266 family)
MVYTDISFTSVIGGIMQAAVKGTTMPVLEVSLSQGDTIISNRGEFSWMTSNVKMSQTGGGSAHGGLLGGVKRALGGGSILLTEFTVTEGQGFVSFAAKLPGHIAPVEISPGHEWFVHHDGWVCGTEGVNPSFSPTTSFKGTLFGSEGFTLQKLEGQGTAWIELGGELIDYELQQGQELLVHPGHVAAFESTIAYTAHRLPGIANRWAGGDGHWVASVTGPGRLWLQTMPVSILASDLQPYLPTTTQRPSGGLNFG